jgi:hypothetical protein
MDEKTHGREPVFAKANRRYKDKIKMDPGFRRDDGDRRAPE